MKAKTLSTLILVCAATVSCGESPVVPAPCNADGRAVTVFYTSAGGDALSDTGKFTGWNEYWVTLKLESGRVIHLSTDTVTAIHEFGK